MLRSLASRLGRFGTRQRAHQDILHFSRVQKHSLVLPSAPSNPVTCNYGAVMSSWFDIHDIPVTADSPKDESSLLKAVQNVHKIIDKEIAAGANPSNVFLCGFSQGGALTLASVLLYPKTFGGGAVFSVWVPFNSLFIEQIPAEAKRIIPSKHFRKTSKVQEVIPIPKSFSKMRFQALRRGPKIPEVKWKLRVIKHQIEYDGNIQATDKECVF